MISSFDRDIDLIFAFPLFLVCSQFFAYYSIYMAPSIKLNVWVKVHISSFLQYTLLLFFCLLFLLVFLFCCKCLQHYLLFVDYAKKIHDIIQVTIKRVFWYEGVLLNKKSLNPFQITIKNIRNKKIQNSAPKILKKTMIRENKRKKNTSKQLYKFVTYWLRVDILSYSSVYILCITNIYLGNKRSFRQVFKNIIP